MQSRKKSILNRASLFNSGVNEVGAAVVDATDGERFLMDLNSSLAKLGPQPKQSHPDTPCKNFYRFLPSPKNMGLYCKTFYGRN